MHMKNMKKTVIAFILVITLAMPGSAALGKYDFMVSRGIAENYSLGRELSFTAVTNSSANPARILSLAASIVPYSFSLEWEWGNGYTTWRLIRKDNIRNIPAGLTTIESIFNYVINQTVYDLNAPNAYSAQGVFDDGRAVCDGYSRAVLLLCQKAGIPCLYIGSTTINHSYNLVYQDGKWYILDATWSDTGNAYSNYFMIEIDDLPGHHPDPNVDLLIEDAIIFGEWYYGLSAPPAMTAADADFLSQLEMAEVLRGIGMFVGTGAGFELNRAPTRMELAVMFVRAMNLEPEALAFAGECPFTDVPPWAAGYAALLYDMGLAKGYGDGIFGAADIGTARDYATFLLRAMGYNESAGDFEWATANETAAAMGFLAGTNPFLRGDVAEMTLRALLINESVFAAQLGIVLDLY